uniref:Putative nucleolar and coiled-body phosphoprotein 1 n=1 Tax=Anopheles triannulatus TaxID=58253 RepID=A0A2M4AE45_9DIPT
MGTPANRTLTKGRVFTTRELPQATRPEVPRPKKAAESVGSASKQSLETLTAGRTRRTIKPNPKYVNDEMVAAQVKESFDESEMSDEEFDELIEEEDQRSPPPTPRSEGPKRRGRPPKSKNLITAPRTEPTKNLRKEVMKRVDLRSLGIGQTRQRASPQLRETARRLDMTDSIDTDSADQDDLGMEGLEEGGNRRGSYESTGRKGLNSSGGSVKILRSNADGTTEDDEMEDDEDLLNENDRRQSSVQLKRPVGRPRKNPLLKKQVSPFAAKVLLPGMKQTLGGGVTVMKRKAPPPTDSEDDGKQQGSKMVRRSYPKGGIVAKEVVDTDTDDDEDDDGEREDDNSQRRTVQRGAARSYPTLVRRSGPNTPQQQQQQQQQQGRDSGAGKSESKENSPSQMITIVNVNDIMKMKSKSTADAVRQRKVQEDEDSEDDRSELEETGDGAQGESKTNNKLVASILERKRAIPVQPEVTPGRTPRERHNAMMKKRAEENRQNQSTKGGGGSEVDVEEVLQKTIVTAGGSNKTVVRMQSAPTPGGAAGRPRGRPPNSVKAKENLAKDGAGGGGGTALVGGDAGGGTGGYQSKNILYKSTNNGRYAVSSAVGGGTPLKRSNQPPRILNATMKLGQDRPQSKLSATTTNNHYSIDLTDPDNNVLLVSSNENSPVKRPLVSGTIGSSPALAGKVILGRSPGTPGTAAITTSTPSGAVASSVRLAQQRLQQSQSTPQPQQQKVATAGRPVDVRKKRITCYETWNVINCKNMGSGTKKPIMNLSMIALGNVADSIRLPSDVWSLRTVLEKRKTAVNPGEETFCGATQDSAIPEEEKHNYEPTRIMFRRKASVPGRFNVQYDRTVIFRNDTYVINIEGHCCRLVGAPVTIATPAEIETLLTIVDFINMDNSCVEMQGRPLAPVDTAGAKRVTEIAA